MLQQIRQSAKSGFSYILVAVLIIIFAVSFGAPTDGCRSDDSNAKMATVAGNSIGNEDLNVVYNRYFGGRQLDDDQFNQQRAASLRMVALTYLLADKARQAGLRVDDDEFRAYIMDPNRNIEFRFAYGQSGEFDGPFYKAYVQNQLRVSLPKYEDFKREELLARKYIALIDMQVNVTPQEIEEFNKLRNTEVNLEFVRFSADTLKDSIHISDADVEKFIADNKAEITKNYEENISKYEEPEQVQIRRIFIVKPEGAELAEATKRFEDAKKRVNENNENFADVAGELSEDFAKEKQGLMDWSTLENLDQNIAAAIKDQPVGTVKEVDTDFAFMLVKVEDRKDAVKTPIEDVQDEIARSLLQEKKVNEIATQMAEQLVEEAKAHDSMQAALTTFQTPKDEADDDAENEESDTAANPWDALSVGTTGMFSLEGQDMSAMFGAQFPGLNLGRSPWDRIPDIGKAPELAKDAFKLTEEKAVAQKVYSTDSGKIVVRLKERKDPPAEMTPEQQAKLTDEARQAKASDLLGGAVSVLIQPSEDYGPWLEGMFKQALQDKTIKLNSKRSPVAARVQFMAQPAPALSVELNSDSDS